MRQSTETRCRFEEGPGDGRSGSGEAVRSHLSRCHTSFQEVDGARPGLRELLLRFTEATLAPALAPARSMLTTSSRMRSRTIAQADGRLRPRPLAIMPMACAAAEDARPGRAQRGAHDGEPHAAHDAEAATIDAGDADWGFTPRMPRR